MRIHHRKLVLHLSFTLLLIVAACGNVQAQPQTAKPASGYHLVKRIEVGGEGGWDYLTVDSAARRLYVSHATRVVVIDLDKNAVVGEIPNTNGVHGIAIVSELGRGFTSNGRDNTVTIFDLKTLKVIAQVKTGTNPDAIIYDPASHRVFAFNGRSSDATAIDAASGNVAGTVAVGGKPEFAVADGKGTVFVNIEDKSEIIAIDSNKLTVKSRWPLAPGEEPSGLAMDRKARRLFAVCSNKKMIVMNADNGHVVADLPTGDGTDAAAFDPETNLAFSSNGEGTLTVIHQDSADKYRVVESVTTQRGARTMTLDPKTHTVYLATAQFGPPPAATPDRPRPRPSIVPGSFVILVFGK
jgi:YVTN family beta-propeller protein